VVSKVIYPFDLKTKLFLDSLIKNDLELVLIGGAVRDWLAAQKKTKDLDFEIRSKTNLTSTQEITSKIKEVATHFEATVESLAFSILRIKLGAYELEFSFPRKDIYAQQLEYGHSDFEAKVDLGFDYKQSFKRRDFSINAIGINIENSKLIDPYNGQTDLQNNNLVFINQQDYFKDPVRFLRLLRFSRQLDFKLPNDNVLKQFNLKKITPFYFKKEAFRVNFFKYCCDFFNITSRLNIELPLKLSHLSYLSEIDSKQNVSDPLKALEIIKTCTSENLNEFVEYFEIPKKKWKQTLKEKSS